MGFEDTVKGDLESPMLQAPKRVDAANPPESTAWSTGLFDCCAHPGGGALGCVSCFLPCVQYGILAEQIPKGTVMMAGSFCPAASCFFALDTLAAIANCNLWPGVSLLPTSALLHMGLRSHLRKKYNIKGSACSDLCTAWWCGPCALAQETREMAIRAQSELQVPGFPSSAPVYMMGNMLLSPRTFYLPVHSMPAAGPLPSVMASPVASAPPAEGAVLASAVAVPATGIPVHPAPTPAEKGHVLY